MKNLDLFYSYNWQWKKLKKQIKRVRIMEWFNRFGPFVSLINVFLLQVFLHRLTRLLL
jgi:hypothetical protein